MLSWLLGLITKLILPVVICVSINKVIIHNHFHFRFRDDDIYPYISASSATLSIVGLFNLILDIFYHFDIRSVGFINKAVDYFIVKNHTTIYSMIRFGLSEKPIRTRVFIVYLTVVGISIITATWSTIYYSLRDERRI